MSINTPPVPAQPQPTGRTRPAVLVPLACTSAAWDKTAAPTPAPGVPPGLAPATVGDLASGRRRCTTRGIAAAVLSVTSDAVRPVRYGIARLPDGRRKQVLLAAAADIFTAFEDQVLPVDTAAAENYAAIASSRERAGKPITSFGALIAAVCRSQGAALATRNVSDFEGTGIEIIDPWGANRDSI